MSKNVPEGYVSLCTGSGLKSSYSLHDYADERRALVYYYTSETGGEWKTSAGYIPIGAVLWKSGHVGIYVGNQEVVEARSEELNVEKNNVNGRGFTYCLLIPGVQYEENLTDAAVSVNATVGYIPWIGKIINADLVYPSATPSASSGAAFTGMLLNGAQVTVVGVVGDYYKIRLAGGRTGYLNAYYVGFPDAPAYASNYFSWNGSIKGSLGFAMVRLGPGTTFDPHATVPQLNNGTKVQVIGEQVGEDNRLWYRVRIAGTHLGFIRSDLIEPYTEIYYSPWYGMANSTVGIVNIRVEATINSSLSSLHAPLENGDKVTVTNEVIGADGDKWFRVEVDGIAAGYCRADLIIPYVEGYYSEWDGELYSAAGAVNLRKGPGTGYNTVTGSPYANGTPVHVLGEEEGTDGYTWYKLTVAGLYTGYSRCDLVRTTARYDSFLVYANAPAGYLNIRTGAGSGYSNLTACPTVNNGTNLRVIDQMCGTDHEVWYKVLISGQYQGYVYAGMTRPVNTAAYPVWTGSANGPYGVVNVRSEATTASDTITGHPQMTNGETFEVIDQVSATDGYLWYKIRILNQYIGYVRSDLVTHGMIVTETRDYAEWVGYVQSAPGYSQVVMRKGPGTGFDPEVYILNGTNVEVIGTANGNDNYVWYQVKYGTFYGYIRSDLVYHTAVTTTPYQQVDFAYKGVIIAATDLYEGPFSTAETVKSFPVGTFFAISKKIITGNGNIWYQVTDEENDQGFVPMYAVRVFPQAEYCHLDNDPNTEHEFSYPDGDTILFCEKCGYHVKYQKPSKAFTSSKYLSTTSDVGLLPAYDPNENSDSYKNVVISYNLFIDMLRDIEEDFYDYFDAYREANPGAAVYSYGEEVVFFMCGLGRHNVYDKWYWNTILLGSGYNGDYISQVQDPLLKKELALLSLAPEDNEGPIIDLGECGYLEWKHFAATLQGYYQITALAPSHFFGWGADLATLAGDVLNNPSSVGEEIQCACELMGRSPANGPSSFSYTDFISDVDAIGIANLLKLAIMSENKYAFSDCIVDYYENHVSERKTNLLTDIFSLANSFDLNTLLLSQWIEMKLTEPVFPLDMPGIGSGPFSLIWIFGSGHMFRLIEGETTLAELPSEDIIDAVCQAFAKYIMTETDDMLV